MMTVLVGMISPSTILVMRVATTADVPCLTDIFIALLIVLYLMQPLFRRQLYLPELC